MTPDDAESATVTGRRNAPELEREVSLADGDASAHAGGSYGAEREFQPDDGGRDFDDGGAHAPERTTRLYIGLWLPAAGALLSYAVLRSNYWAAFIGIELLLVGWFTLGKL